ncbi:hypothetical protein D5086_021241 [Populus alba]|uniref:Uncharacterized protein n=1 Tax=Populus alba TaxID=43335 RepID=A0ACC4BDE5_POPAL
MDSLRLIVLFSFSCILLASLSIAQPDFLYQSCRNTENNYTANSTFQKNLDSILSSLASNTQIDYGYYNFSAGQIGPDQVHALALCRGDILLNECRGCVSNSVRKILQVCPNQKEAIGIYDFCILRYSNRSSFGVLDGEFIVYTWNTENASHVNLFSQALGNLTSRLRTAAASENGNTTRKVVIIIVSVLVFMAVVVITSIFLYGKQEVINQSGIGHLESSINEISNP